MSVGIGTSESLAQPFAPTPAPDARIRVLPWSPPAALAARGYPPLVAVTMALMLHKGYHLLLAVRDGARDLDAIDASYFDGLTWLRHGVYGAAHIGMAVSLGVFLVALWRSLRRA